MSGVALVTMKSLETRRLYQEGTGKGHQKQLEVTVETLETRGGSPGNRNQLKIATPRDYETHLSSLILKP